MTERVVYFKGGRAIEEAHRLFPRIGELPDGGPDKFLLAVLHHSDGASFRLTSFGPRTERITLMGREVVEYGARPDTVSAPHRRGAYLTACVRFLWDTLRFKPTRVLCGQDGPFALFAWAAARLTGARFVLLAHNALALPSASRATVATNRFICRRADLIVTHGPFVHDEAIALGANPACAVEFNNALDPEHIHLVESLPPKGEGYGGMAADAGPVVLYVGRVEERKGVIDLFQAWLRMSQEMPRLRLRFVGDGAANEALRAMAVKHGVTGRVEVLGPVAFESVFAHMKQAAVVVTPSQSAFPEGFCKSAMEAFYVGTPVVAPDYGPFPYMVKHEENGLLYRADDVDALTDSLRRLLGDSGLYARLREGAVRWGRHFMHPSLTFAKAMDRVFDHGR